MGCNTIQFGDGQSAIICSGRRRRETCHKCMKLSQYQCDFPVGKTKAGKTKTCDRHICVDHAKHGVTKGIDFCEEHYDLAKAAYERRRLKLRTMRDDG